jgi:spermidine synthase
MDTDLNNELTASPQLVEAQGELSLHFGFPTIQSRMLKADPEQLVLDYTRTMMGFLLLQPAPCRIAMVGLGGGSLLKYCRRRLPATEFTAIEISPEVIALRRQFGIPDDDERLRVICADGADFVRRAAASGDGFDVLLIDGFDRDGQARQLCSAAFYDDCRGVLRTGGVLVVNLCADDTGYGSYIARISDSFDGKAVVVEAEEGDNKIVFAAADGDFPPTLVTLSERLRQLEANHPVGLDRTAQKILERARTRQGARQRRR